MVINLHTLLRILVLYVTNLFMPFVRDRGYVIRRNCFALKESNPTVLVKENDKIWQPYNVGTFISKQKKMENNYYKITRGTYVPLSIFS